MASLLSRIGVAGVQPMGADFDPGCHGKMGYSVKAYADNAVAFRRHRKGAITVYRCPTCDLWHVGSRMGNKL